MTCASILPRTGLNSWSLLQTRPRFQLPVAAKHFLRFPITPPADGVVSRAASRPGVMPMHSTMRVGAPVLVAGCSALTGRMGKLWAIRQGRIPSRAVAVVADTAVSAGDEINVPRFQSSSLRRSVCNGLRHDHAAQDRSFCISCAPWRAGKPIAANAGITRHQRSGLQSTATVRTCRPARYRQSRSSSVQPS